MKHTAPRYIILTLALIAVLSLPQISQAATDVNNDIEISNNGNNSESSISVNNGSTKSHTHVVIEQNGQTKTYDSDNGENVDLQSDDGKNQVHIHNSNPPQTSPRPTEEEDKQDNATPSADAHISQAQAEISKAQQKIKEAKTHAEEKLKEHQGALQQLINALNNFFKHFKF